MHQINKLEELIRMFLQKTSEKDLKMFNRPRTSSNKNNKNKRKLKMQNKNNKMSNRRSQANK